MDVSKVSADLLQAFEVDLPEPDSLVPELRMWKSKWSASAEGESSSSILQMLEDTAATISKQELMYPTFLKY